MTATTTAPRSTPAKAADKPTVHNAKASLQIAPAAAVPQAVTLQAVTLQAATLQPPTPELPDLSAFQPTSSSNPLGWDLRPIRITCYGPDQSGTLRQYSDNARANSNPPLVGLAGLLLGVDIIPAAADQPQGGRLYLSIDLQGQLPEQINQLRLRIGTGPQDRNWPIRTALYGLTAGDFRLGSEVGLSTRSGSSIYFIDVLHHSGRSVIPPRGYWSSPDSIGYTPLDILLAVNNLRRRLEQDDLGPEVFGDLLHTSVDINAESC